MRTLTLILLTALLLQSCQSESETSQDTTTAKETETIEQPDTTGEVEKVGKPEKTEQPYTLETFPRKWSELSGSGSGMYINDYYPYYEIIYLNKKNDKWYLDHYNNGNEIVELGSYHVKRFEQTAEGYLFEVSPKNGLGDETKVFQIKVADFSESDFSRWRSDDLEVDMLMTYEPDKYEHYIPEDVKKGWERYDLLDTFPDKWAVLTTNGEGELVKKQNKDGKAHIVYLATDDDASSQWLVDNGDTDFGGEISDFKQTDKGYVFQTTRGRNNSKVTHDIYVSDFSGTDTARWKSTTLGIDLLMTSTPDKYPDAE